MRKFSFIKRVFAGGRVGLVVPLNANIKRNHVTALDQPWLRRWAKMSNRWVLNGNFLSVAFILNQSNAKLCLKMSSKTTTNKCQCYLQYISENLWLASLGIFNQKSLEKRIVTETDKNKSPSEENYHTSKYLYMVQLTKFRDFFVILPFAPFFSNSVLNVLTRSKTMFPLT